MALRKYRWEEWFGKPRTVLERGVHYHCSQSTMAQTIRNNASQRGLRARLTDTGTGIVVEVVRGSNDGRVAMRLIEKSSLDAYARQFWQRQEQKRNRDDEPAISSINRGDSPVSWLANIYPYKLPQPYNATIEVVELQAADELDKLLIHDYMIRDNWMVERCLVPCRKTRRLGDMAQLALERKYFETDRADTQIKLYRAWKDKSSLDGFIGDNEYPLLELMWERELEIVDGWGRLHAMSALVRQQREFKPFKAFVASRAGSEPLYGLFCQQAHDEPLYGLFCQQAHDEQGKNSSSSEAL